MWVLPADCAWMLMAEGGTAPRLPGALRVKGGWDCLPWMGAAVPRIFEAGKGFPAQGVPRGEVWV